MKYASIDALWQSDSYTYCLETICVAHGVSRQAFYHYQKHQATECLKQEMVLQLVCQVRVRQPRIGVRKLYQLLTPQFEQLDLQLGRDALFGLLRAHGLLIASPKRGHQTTCANHRFHRYPNRITNLVVDRIHQVFVADITYLQTLDGFVYLALVTDLFSRKIVGFDVSDSLAVEGALRACKMAIKPVTNPNALIHHSDRGVQYCCHAYTQLLDSRGIQLSMTQNGLVFHFCIISFPNNPALGKNVEIVKGGFVMKILSKKLAIVWIVLVGFIVVCLYFGKDWSAQDLPVFDGEPDQLTTDLEQTRVRLKNWSDDFLNQFPDVPAAKAMVEIYQEILSEVTARNEQLRQEGVSMKKRIKQLTQFAKEISGPIAKRTRSTELQLELMRENSALKKKIDRYTHTNVILPLPLYLLGANKRELETLQKILEASQHGP